MLTALQSRAVEEAGPLEEKFATSAGRWLGWIGVAVGLAIVVFDPLTSEFPTLTAICIGVTVAALCWVVLVRPQASAHRNALLLQNMLRDTAIPWPRIERCRVGQTLVVSTTEAETFHGLGVTRSARAQMREQYGTTSILFNFGSRAAGRRLQQGGGPSVAKGEWQGDTYTSYIESRIAGLASRGERGRDVDDAPRPIVAWAPLPVALTLIAAVALVVAIFS